MLWACNQVAHKYTEEDGKSTVTVWSGFTWVIKVVLAFESFGLLIWGQDFVEAVLADDGYLPLAVVHLVLTKKLHDLGANSRL